MEVSIFLAKLFGLYMLILAAIWIVRGHAIAAVIEEVFESRPMIFFSGLLALAAGIAIVIGHPVWEPSWRGLITVIGLVSIAKGIVRIGFPDLPKKSIDYLLQGNRLYVWISIILILGGYLTWVGFTH